MLALAPITQREAFAWVRAVHSHLPTPPPGALTCVQVLDGERRCCVAVLGRPSARKLQDGLTAEITRVASDRTPHAASKAIAALTRAAVALGYTRVVSYTLADEAGTSYRAAGWTPVAESGGGEWSRPSRARGAAVQAGPKTRWEYQPPEEARRG